MDIVKRLWHMLRPYRKLIFFGLLLQAISAGTRLYAPQITGNLVDNVIKNQQFQLLFPLVLQMIVLTVMRSASVYGRAVFMERASQNLIFDMRTGLYRHLSELPYEFYDKHRIGDIMSRLTGDIEGVRNLVAGGIITIVENVLFFVGALVCIFFMNAKLALLMVVLAPLVALVAWQFGKRIRPAFANIREQNAVLNTRTQENLAGIRVVKAFAREDYEREEFSKDNMKQLDMNMRATRLWANFHPLLEIMSGLCLPVLLLGGGTMAVRGEISVGTLVAVVGYVWMINSPMRMLSNIINMLAQAIASAEKLFYYMDFGSAIREREQPRQPESYRGHVEFDHVSFGYGDQRVLHDICFEALPGQTIALMGATGSGKTSVVNLIGRFYDVREGSVRVDGIDVREHAIAPLRQTIGYVPQETFLFSDTLTDNVRFGAPDAAQSRVEAAADVAQATDFIAHMPQGYETIVGERGMGLSGGQKQRVAIARAVLIDPRILVLDDSTSAIDMETEYEIQRKLEVAKAGRTTFIIAHRISSVKDADQILVLDKGRIAERGTHDTLLSQRGLYYGMYMDQYRDFESINQKKAGEA